MTDEKKAKVKALRQRLANLTEAERNAFAARGLVSTVDGHQLSLKNTILCHFQSARPPSIVGGFQQWRRAGKHVRKGEHGMVIWFPAVHKDTDGDDETTETRFYTATVFDISQVEDNDAPATTPTPGPQPQAEPEPQTRQLELVGAGNTPPPQSNDIMDKWELV